MLATLLGRKKHPSDIVDGPPVRFSFAPGTFHNVFEKKPQPDLGGAGEYAYESLALEQYTPIGPGTAVRQQIRATQPGGLWFSSNQVWANGVPTTAGQIAYQPLVDPQLNGGYNPPDITLGYPDAAGFNLVRQFAPMTEFNDPSPYGIRKGV